MTRGNVLVLFLCGMFTGGIGGPETPADETGAPANEVTAPLSDSGREVIRLLKSLAGWVGEWRGVVQPRRGSSAGAWTEKATVAWDISDVKTELVLALEPGRELRRLRLTVDEETHGLVAILESAAGVEERLIGTPAATNVELVDPGASESSGAWVFTAAEGAARSRRVTIRLLSGIRATVLLEERSAENATWKRQWECGLTRSGARLAATGSGEKQCVVTGGLGTLSVEFEGETYFVCCEGCRQVFQDDPRGTLAAYRQRLKSESDR